jgi:hypothetical protein
MLRNTFTLAANAAVTTSVAGSQTPTGVNAAVTLTANPVVFTNGTAQLLTITSLGADISNRTFTIVGLDVTGKPLTVTQTGPGVGATVTTALPFKQVNSINISNTAAGAITIGNSASSETPYWLCDVDANPFALSFRCINTSGNPTYSIQYSWDDPAAVAYNAMVWTTDATITGKTGTNIGTMTQTVMLMKVIATTAGTVQVKVFQAGGGFR